jgi:transposase
MLSYKCALEGIQIIEQEESYTSKCSFLDDEPIKKHEAYAGRRVKRGLFKSALGTFINADLNASYNIMKKAISDYLLVKFDGIEDVVVHPRLISV